MQTADAGASSMEFDLGPVIGATATLFVGAGAVVRWLVTRQDNMHAADRKWDKDARDALEAQFNEKLTALHSTFEAQIRAQSSEVRFLKSELHRYIKHVGVLEGILKSHDIDIPPIEPPPLHGTSR